MGVVSLLDDTIAYAEELHGVHDALKQTYDASTKRNRGLRFVPASDAWLMRSPLITGLGNATPVEITFIPRSIHTPPHAT